MSSSAIESYDANLAPRAKDWLALDGWERVRLAMQYHVSQRVRGPGLRYHAAAHAFVETQLALGHGPSRRALQRLIDEGMDRHRALHEILSVYRLIYRPVMAADAQQRLNAGLDALGLTGGD